MRKTVCLIVTMMLGLTGCSEATASTPVPTASEVAQLPQSTPVTQVNTQSAEGELPAKFLTNPGIAIAPIPRAMTIGNYELGCDFTFVSYFHNGDGLRAKLSKITTDVDETVAAIPINVTLANNGLLDIVSLESTILKKDATGEYKAIDTTKSEKLEAIAYDGSTNLLTIKGFLPNETRIMKLTYRTVSNFSVEYTMPPKTQPGFSFAPVIFKHFVEIQKTTLTMKPMETVKIPIRINIPPNWRVENKNIEFELLVSEVGSNTAGTVGVTQAIAQPILITLK